VILFRSESNVSNITVMRVGGGTCGQSALCSMLLVHAASKCLHIRIQLTSPLSHTTLGRMSWNELLWLGSLEQDLKSWFVDRRQNECLWGPYAAYYGPVTCLLSTGSSLQRSQNCRVRLWNVVVTLFMHTTVTPITVRLFVSSFPLRTAKD